MAERKVLILFAHPALQKSRVNRVLARAVREIPNVTFHDLYEIYPDGMIDVAFEQEQLKRHDVIVAQHPFYWYSVPSLLKEWIDLVLEYGFAYGEGGHQLEGKAWMHAMTTGGAATAYAKTGSNRYTIRELLAPLEQTARLCGMKFLRPFVVHSTLTLDPQREIPEIARQYAEHIRSLTKMNSTLEEFHA